MILPKKDVRQLRWLDRQRSPVWGAHLKRGDPITDPSMQSWLDQGLIQQIGEGYVLTNYGRKLIAE